MVQMMIGRLRTSAFAVLAFLPLTSGAQVPDLRWEYSVTSSAAGEAEIIFTAAIPDGWILYSSDFKAELGPRAARFKFEPNDAVQVVGEIEAVKSSRRTDKNFGIEYAYFTKRAEFRQRVRIASGAASVSGQINGQTCQEVDGLCTLFKQPFQIQMAQARQ